MTERPKIFGLGLGKTGTSSLHAGLGILGFNSCHHLHKGEPGRLLVARALQEGRPALAHMPGHDAYLDMELYDHLEVLDREHPGSRWILTIRDVDTWVVSVRAHNERHTLRTGEVRATNAAAEVMWRRERERVAGVIEQFFAGRPDDLLVMDIVAGDGWDKLCGFLGAPEPNVEFPHRNRRPDAPAGRSTMARLRRRARRLLSSASR